MAMKPRKRRQLQLDSARKGCGSEFRLKRSDQRFCSEACRNAAWKRLNGLASKKRRLALREALPERPKTQDGTIYWEALLEGVFPQLKQ
jgi:hypothetical protein